MHKEKTFKELNIVYHIFLKELQVLVRLVDLRIFLEILHKVHGLLPLSSELACQVFLELKNKYKNRKTMLYTLKN